MLGLIEPYIDKIMELFYIHPYLLLFVGLLFAGESILLPAIYAALLGKLEMSYVIGIAMLATTISDCCWYYIGVHMQDRYVSNIVNERVKNIMAKLSVVFNKRGPLILYLSKFVYGTRIAAQVLSGTHKMPFRKYISVNFLGVLSLTFFILGLAYVTNETVSHIEGIVHNVEIAFLAFVAILVLAHVVVGKYLKKTWFQR